MDFLLAFAMAVHDEWRQPPVPATDLEFACAVEETVRGFLPHSKAPDPWPDIFRRMGSPSYRERQDASQDAMVQITGEPADARWLWWGRRDRDIEVAVRCNALVRRINPCRECKGMGVIHWSASYPPFPCHVCYSTGSAWFRSALD